MRTIETKVYTFDELSEEAKQNAIESIRNSYYEFNEFGQWAVDDCYLFEPIHKELTEMFGEDFYEILNKDKKYKDTPLIGNNRKDIYFDCEARYRYLDCTTAMEINNDTFFLLWLGIPKEMHGIVTYNIYSKMGRYGDTSIEFDHIDCEDFTDEQNDLLNDAVDKFDEHIMTVLQNISDSIDYRFTDEAIKEDIESNEYEFLETGEQF
ncbi:MAG: hypothetical protein PQJ49_06235 [Sphaerochaetaceae bacterium]|nr:hypothetical protein [Sphaerochaetaceae bacterium]